MPHIITATRVAERDFEGEPLHTITRHAVATLADVRHELHALLAGYDADISRPRGQVMRLRESGGTVGPLPDGAVIEVTPISWASIMSAQMIEAGAYEAAIDAYNSWEANNAWEG